METDPVGTFFSIYKMTDNNDVNVDKNIKSSPKKSIDTPVTIIQIRRKIVSPPLSMKRPAIKIVKRELSLHLSFLETFTNKREGRGSKVHFNRNGNSVNIIRRTKRTGGITEKGLKLLSKARQKHESLTCKVK